MTFEITRATVSFDGIPALRDISFAYGGTGIVVVTGPTGAGKTTFLGLLAARIQPTLGEVTVDGTGTRTMRSRAVRALRRRMGIVQQSCALLSYADVYDNIRLPLAAAGVGKAEASRKALQIMADLQVSHVRTKYPSELSGGARHLVALARALVTEPDVVLADEPTGTLDDATARTVIDVLREANGRGIGIVLSTHSAMLASAFPEAQYLHLVDGQLRERTATETTAETTI